MKKYTITTVLISFLCTLPAALAQPGNTVQFSSSQYWVAENAGSVTISVHRMGEPSGTVTVDYATFDGTATAWDYTPTWGTLTFASGETIKAFTVSIMTNPFVEGDKTVNLELSNPTGATLKDPITAVLTIVDIERPGSLDFSFDVSAGVVASGTSVAWQADGQVLVGNLYPFFNGHHGTVARLNPDGSLDASFEVVVEAADCWCNTAGVRSIVPLNDGKVLISGLFDAVNGLNRTNLARLNSDGSVDVTFAPTIERKPFLSSSIVAPVVQPDGRIVIAGDFNTLNGVTREGIARLNSDGSVDASFDPGSGVRSISPDFPGRVYAMSLQTDGKLIIGGAFDFVNNADRHRIARLNEDGSVDTAFNPGLVLDAVSMPFVGQITIQHDDKIIIGGDFGTFNGINRAGIARLEKNGELDLGFKAPWDNPFIVPNSLAVDENGKILVAGLVSGGVVRLNPDGSLDTSFDATAAQISDCRALSLQPDGNVLVAGSFGLFNGVPRAGVVRLNGGGNHLKLSPPTRSVGNSWRLTLTAQPGKAYVLESSTNLADWLPLRTNTAVGFTLRFEDANAADFPRRFYRAALH